MNQRAIRNSYLESRVAIKSLKSQITANLSRDMPISLSQSVCSKDEPSIKYSHRNMTEHTFSFLQLGSWRNSNLRPMMSNRPSLQIEPPTKHVCLQIPFPLQVQLGLGALRQSILELCANPLHVFVHDRLRARLDLFSLQRLRLHRDIGYLEIGRVKHNFLGLLQYIQTEIKRFRSDPN